MPLASAEREVLSLTLHTPNANPEVRFAFDMASSVQAEMHRLLSGGQFYEPETTMLLLTVLRPGDCFVDVGGHVGYFSIIASKVVGPTGEVLVFEPAPSNYAQLLSHLALNGCDNVLPLHLAAGPADKAMILHLNSDNDGGHALWDVRMHALNEKSRAHPAQVDGWMTRLSRVVSGRSVRAMKLDIEGSEFGALQGAEPLLAGPAGVPFIIAEINRTGLECMGTNETQLRDYMDALGYDTWLLQAADPQLQLLEPGVLLDCNYVFNVLFWKRGVSIT